MKFIMKMKTMLRKSISALVVAVNTSMLYAATAFASNENETVNETVKETVKETVEKNPFEQIAVPIVKLIEDLFAPAMAIVVAAGTLYCIVLGVKFAKAEEPQEHEKAKTHLKNAIIGFVLIFVLVVALRLSVEPLTTWMNEQ